MIKKEINRKKRHYKIRKKIEGTPERPRVHVNRSLKNLHVQVIDDLNQKVIFGVGTTGKDFRTKLPYGGNVAAAKELGLRCSEILKEKNIEQIKFDRAGFSYHGRIKAFADVLREAGIQF